MKSTTIILLLLPMASLFAQEQHDSYRYVAGGQFNFSRTAPGRFLDPQQPTGFSDRTEQTFDLQPYMAKKIGKNMLLGFRLGYRGDSEAYKADSGSKYKYFQRTYSVGVFSRHYLTPEKAFRFFLEPSALVARTNNAEKKNSGDREYLYHENQFLLQVSPGVSYRLTEHLGLLVKLGQFGYRRAKVKIKDETQSWGQVFFADFNLASFALGMEYRWGE